MGGQDLLIPARLLLLVHRRARPMIRLPPLAYRVVMYWVAIVGVSTRCMATPLSIIVAHHELLLYFCFILRKQTKNKQGQIKAACAYYSFHHSYNNPIIEKDIFLLTFFNWVSCWVKRCSSA